MIHAHANDAKPFDANPDFRLQRRQIELSFPSMLHPGITPRGDGSKRLIWL
jgi:hypothetical protein